MLRIGICLQSLGFALRTGWKNISGNSQPHTEVKNRLYALAALNSVLSWEQVALELHSPIRLQGMDRRNFACTHLTGSRLKQEPILRLGESVFPLTTIEPGTFHRAASNPSTVPTPSTCVSTIATTTTTTTTTNEHQPSNNRHDTAKKAVGNCVFWNKSRFQVPK